MPTRKDLPGFTSVYPAAVLPLQCQPQRHGPKGPFFFHKKNATFHTMQNKLMLVVLAGAAMALAGSWRRAGSVALLSLADPTGPLSDEEVAAFIFSFFCDAVLGSVA